MNNLDNYFYDWNSNEYGKAFDLIYNGLGRYFEKSVGITVSKSAKSFIEKYKKFKESEIIELITSEAIDSYSWWFKKSRFSYFKKEDLILVYYISNKILNKYKKSKENDLLNISNKYNPLDLLEFNEIISQIFQYMREYEDTFEEHVHKSIENFFWLHDTWNNKKIIAYITYKGKGENWLRSYIPEVNASLPLDFIRFTNLKIDWINLIYYNVSPKDLGWITKKFLNLFSLADLIYMWYKLTKNENINSVEFWHNTNFFIVDADLLFYSDKTEKLFNINELLEDEIKQKLKIISELEKKYTQDDKTKG